MKGIGNNTLRIARLKMLLIAAKGENVYRRLICIRPKGCLREVTCKIQVIHLYETKNLAKAF